MSKLKTILTALGTAAVLVAAPQAGAAVGEGYQVGGTPVLMTWWGRASPEAMAADRAYVAGMRPHHAGALTMAQEYLGDPAASSPVLRALAAAIIRNQAYEIALLDEVGRNLALPAVTVGPAWLGLRLQPMATDGLGQSAQFIKSPIPGPLLMLTAPGAPVTERDVRFAKGMTIHHQAALDMARAYVADPAASNTFLRLLNVEIVTDQTQEIRLMRSVVAAYPGDADAVVVDPASIHGMEGMGHGHAGHVHAPEPTAALAQAAPGQVLAPAAAAAHPPHHASPAARPAVRAAPPPAAGTPRPAARPATAPRTGAATPPAARGAAGHGADHHDHSGHVH